MRPITQQQLGKRFAELRKRANLTQGEVAQHLGVADETISRLERGTQWTDFPTLVGLCKLYKVEWADLMAVSSGTNSAQHEAVQKIVDSLRSCSLPELKLVQGLVEAVVSQGRKRRAGQGR
jgi:transcriptional regulator with XRE-family HTH domain